MTSSSPPRTTSATAAPAPHRDALLHTHLPAFGVYLAGPDDVVVELSLAVAGLLPVRPTMAALDACLVIEEDPLDSWLRVDLDAGSIRTGTPFGDVIARGPDALDTEGFGIVRFESTSLHEVAPQRFAIPGDLYVRDLCAPVTLDARLVADGDRDGVARLAFSADLSRRELELWLPERWARAEALVGDRVRLCAGIAFTLSDPDPSEVLS